MLYAGPMPAWDNCEEVAAQWLNAFRDQWAPKTTIRRRGTLRRWAEHAGCPFAFLAKYRCPKPAGSQPHPIQEGIGGVLDMVASTNNPRHKALIALTGLAGLRVDEAVRVEPDHINLATKELTVRGKGDKVRVIPLSLTCLNIIMPAYAAAIMNKTTLCRITNSGGRKSIRRHGRRANLQHQIASHDMRATAATAMYEKTKDLRAVQEILGHASSHTTEVYTRISAAARRAAVEVV